MRGALQNTSWPTLAIYSDAKELIAKFFELVDLPDPNSGKKLAEEVFTTDDALAAGPNKSLRIARECLDYLMTSTGYHIPSMLSLL